MTFIPQLPIYFFFNLFYFIFSLAQPAEVLPAASLTRILAPIAALPLPGDPPARLPSSSKGAARSEEAKCRAAQVGWGVPGLSLPLRNCKSTLTRWMRGREVSPP